jgi:asparagine synthetase B (glutamine-hydrolysing)
MCGITILWGPAITKQSHAASMKTLQHRGPNIESHKQLILANGIHVGFVRLHIQGSRHGAEQPFQAGEHTVVCNGEIYNAGILQRLLSLDVPRGSSDCAVIPALIGRGFTLAGVARQLDGDFAIASVGASSIEVTRDPYGVRPLRVGRGNGWWGVVSESVAWPSPPDEEFAVQPGAVLTIDIATGRTTNTEIWHQPPWLKIPYWRSSLEGLTAGGQALRHALEESVTKRLVGLADIALWDRDTLGSILIGRLVGAKKVHRVSGASIAEAAETASSAGCRVLLIDRGCTELFGAEGSLDAADYEGAIDKALCDIQTEADDVAAAAHSVEVRSPFLDRQFVAVARGLPTDALQAVGEGLLRTAFDG